MPRIIGQEGPPPGGGLIGVTVNAPPVVAPPGGAEPCACADVTMAWAVPDEGDPLSTQSSTVTPANLSADGTICPTATWTFDIEWDGDEGDIPTIVQVGLSAWKIVATATGTVIITPTMDCGAGLVAFPPMTDVIGESDCTGPVDWKDLKNIATVTANPDGNGETSSYADGVYSMNGLGTGDYGDYGTFKIEIDEANLPIVCRLVFFDSPVLEFPNIDSASFQNSAFTRGFFLLTTTGSTSLNVNFSIFAADGYVKIFLVYTHGGDYTPLTFRIDYIATIE